MIMLMPRRHPPLRNDLPFLLQLHHLHLTLPDPSRLPHLQAPQSIQVDLPLQ